MTTPPIPVLLNPHSGAAKADPNIERNVRAAFKAAGVAVKIHRIDGDGCARRCKRHAKRGDPLVIVGGGDGTISTAASELIGSKTALGILPLGTLNHFARDLGIEFDLAKAAAVIARGRKMKVDVAELNGRIFINNSAVGLYPLMVLDREAQQKRLGRSKRLALIVASLRTLFRFHHHRLTLRANGDKKAVDSPLLFVGNNDYRIDLGGAGERASLSDGRLCVMVMRKKTRRSFVASGIRALFNRARDDDMAKLDDVTRLQVDSHRRTLAVSLDGEVEHVATPLNYRIRPKALNVIAP